MHTLPKLNKREREGECKFKLLNIPIISNDDDNDSLYIRLYAKNTELN